MTTYHASRYVQIEVKHLLVVFSDQVFLQDYHFSPVVTISTEGPLFPKAPWFSSLCGSSYAAL